MELLDLATTALYGIGHDRPHLSHAIQAAGGVGHSPRGRRVAQRAEPPDSLWHPAGPVQPDEGCVLALTRGRHQDVDKIRLRPADAVVPDGGQTSDHAAGTDVQQRGHLLLDDRRRPRPGDINAGQQGLPRSAWAKAMPERTFGNPGGGRLMARYDINLLRENLVKRSSTRSPRFTHARIMRLRYDKAAFRKLPQTG